MFTLSPSSLVAFAGSRSLRSLPAGLLPAVLASGAQVAVGCCVGADALVASAVVAAGAAARLSVWAAFGPGGAGSCSLSAVPVVQSAAAAGAAVRWWAGGPASLPLRARLARRSAGCAASASLLVLLSPGAGSLAAALPAAVRARVPVVVFAPAAPASGPAWAASAFQGLPCWAWLPATQPALF